MLDTIYPMPRIVNNKQFSTSILIRRSTSFDMEASPPLAQLVLRQQSPKHIAQEIFEGGIALFRLRAKQGALPAIKDETGKRLRPD